MNAIQFSLVLGPIDVNYFSHWYTSLFFVSIE